jgi:hypothetical protein
MANIRKKFKGTPNLCGNDNSSLILSNRRQSGWIPEEKVGFPSHLCLMHLQEPQFEDMSPKLFSPIYWVIKSMLAIWKPST